MRKFVWARSFGVLAGEQNGVFGADLLGQFQQEYGAQLIGSTVVRIRGYVCPTPFADYPVGTVRGSFGVIVGRDTDDYSAPNMAMEQREHDDWLAYLPWRAGVPGADTYSPDIHHTTSNANSAVYAVDLKSSRKIEELGQTLQLWRNNPADSGGSSMDWHLSIGLKLP